MSFCLYHDDTTGEDVFRYGVAGDLIVGKLFLGKELNLLGGAKDYGTYAVTLNENGLTIISDGTTAGIVIKDSNGNKQLYADSDMRPNHYPIHLSYQCILNRQDSRLFYL